MTSANRTVQNAMAARNATVDPRVKKAYDDYSKAKAKFDKWWNPSRRLSEGDNSTVRQYQETEREFGRVFREVYGKLVPSGWGGMTLEQMVSKVANSKTVANANMDKKAILAGMKNFRDRAWQLLDYLEDIHDDVERSGDATLKAKVKPMWDLGNAIDRALNLMR